MKYTKDIFDYRSLSNEIKSKLKLDLPNEDPFRKKIYNLFNIAKDHNIKKLSDNQVAVAYYRTYTKKNPEDFKSLQQIQGKLNSIVKFDWEYLSEHPEVKKETLAIKRVENEKGWYTLA